MFSYLFGFGQKREDHGVLDLLETVSKREWADDDGDRKEVDDIIKRLRYKHPRSPSRTSWLGRRENDSLQLGVVDNFSTMRPSDDTNIKIDTTAVTADHASKLPRGELLRDFDGSVSSKCDYYSEGRSFGTNESESSSVGASAYADRRDL